MQLRSVVDNELHHEIEIAAGELLHLFCSSSVPLLLALRPKKKAMIEKMLTCFVGIESILRMHLSHRDEENSLVWKFHIMTTLAF